MRALLRVMFFVLLIASIAGGYSTAFCKDNDNGDSRLNNSSSKDESNSPGNNSSTKDDGNSLRGDSYSKDKGNSLGSDSSSGPKFQYGGNFRMRVQSSHGLNQ